MYIMSVESAVKIILLSKQVTELGPILQQILDTKPYIEVQIHVYFQIV